MRIDICRTKRSQRSELTNHAGESKAEADTLGIEIQTTGEGAKKEPPHDDTRIRLPAFQSRFAVNKTVCTTTAFFVYSIVSVLYFGLPVLRHFTEGYIGSGTDPTIFIWCLYWWPYALVHGQNLFLTSAIWAPQGTNLAWATAVPGLSFLAAPITFTFGPVASYNTLMLLSPVLAALTTYILIHHLTNAFWPSLIGGYLFGFSSYEIAQMTAHLHLVFILAIPLCTYLAVLFFENRIRPIAFTLLMGVTLSFQFLISTEVFATMTIFGFMGLTLAIVIFPSIRAQILPKGGMVVGAYALAALLISPYVYYLVAFGEPSIMIHMLTNSLVYFSSDLLNIFFPTTATLVGSREFWTLAATFRSNISEEGAYIGLPLLVVISIYSLRLWHSRAGKLLTISLGLIVVASLGPVLMIAGKNTMKLPWRLLIHVPLIDEALPARFMVYASLVISLMAATFLSDLRISKLVKYGLVCLGIVLLIPNLPQGYWAGSISTPAFFSQGLYKDYIGKNENVIIIPYGENGQSMVWQAETGMYFRMAGGYVGLPPSRFGYLPIERTFYYGTLFPGYAEQLRAFLASQDVQAVIVADSEPKVFFQLFDTLGVEPEHIGGVTIYRVPQLTLQAYYDAASTTASWGEDLAQFTRLHSSARYLGNTRALETGSNP
jgi:hypothetical protein